MTEVTILVAVYNAEKFLRQCLDSLLRQTLREIQVICIDDASTDSSLSIIHDYANQDSRIECISLTENKGQAHARNVGLQQARGKYICFLDSDDFFSDDALERASDVFRHHEQTDCVLFRVVNCNEQGKSISDYPMQSFEKVSGTEAFEKSLTWEIHGIYMVRANIHKQFPYDESSKTYSDDNTTRIHYFKSREVRCCEGIYHYRHHSQSVTHRIDASRFNYLRANESMKRQLFELEASDRVLNIYENVRWLVLIDSYMFYFNHKKLLSASERTYGLSEIKRVWHTIETHRLSCRNRIKFGYIPFKWSWRMFRLQEEIYFTLRKVLKKNA